MDQWRRLNTLADVWTRKKIAVATTYRQTVLNWLCLCYLRVIPAFIWKIIIERFTLKVFCFDGNASASFSPLRVCQRGSYSKSTPGREWTIKWSRRRSRGRRRQAHSTMGMWVTASASCLRSERGIDACKEGSGCCRLKISKVSFTIIQSGVNHPAGESWQMSTYQPRSRSCRCRTRWGSSNWSCRLWTGGWAGAGSARSASQSLSVRLRSDAGRRDDSRPARGKISAAAADYSPKIGFTRISL